VGGFLLSEEIKEHGVQNGHPRIFVEAVYVTGQRFCLLPKTSEDEFHGRGFSSSRRTINENMCGIALQEFIDKLGDGFDVAHPVREVIRQIFRGESLSVPVYRIFYKTFHSNPPPVHRKKEVAVYFI